MNIKILTCTAIATSLLFTACVKKEKPKEETHAEPKSSVVNQIPQEQQVMPNANPTDTQVMPEKPADDTMVSLQPEANPHEVTPPVAPMKEHRPAPKRSEPKPAPVEQATPTLAKPESSKTNSPAQAPKASDITAETMDTTPDEAPVNDSMPTGSKDEMTEKASIKSADNGDTEVTPRAKSIPIAPNADKHQSIEDAMRQAKEAATPAK